MEQLERPLSEANSAVAVGRPRPPRAETQTREESEVKNTVSFIASTVLFMALRWLRSGFELKKITIFGRRVFASRHDIAMIRGALACIAGVDKWGQNVTVEFTRQTCHSTRQLRLCVEHEETKIYLTPAHPFLITMMGFGGRVLLVRKFTCVGSGLASLAPILENGLDPGVADEWGKQGRWISLEIGSFRVEMAVVPPYTSFPCPIRQLLDVDEPVRIVAELVNGLKEGENPAAKLGYDRSLFEAFKSIQDLMMSGFRSASLVNKTVLVSLRPDALSVRSKEARAAV